MAAVVDVVMAPAADAQQQKRSFAADITNQGESQPKKPKQDPKKKVLFEWSDADMANSKARVDATKAARACRRPYATIAALQLRHAPKSLSPNAAFYEHASPSAVDAVKARRSGVTLGAKQPLKKRPLFGGMAHVDNARKAPAAIVGVDERLSAGAKNSIEVIARKKQGQGKGGPKPTKGTTFAASFSVWFDGKLVGKYEGRWASALPDIKQKRPGETLTQEMLSCLLGIKKRELLRKKKGLKDQLDASKFTAKYDSD